MHKAFHNSLEWKHFISMFVKQNWIDPNGGDEDAGELKNRDEE